MELFDNILINHFPLKITEELIISRIKEKITFKEIVQQFSKRGFSILSDETKYKSQGTRLKCICEKHSEKVTEISYNELLKGKRCKQCINDSLRFTYEFVYDYFKEQGCELLSETYKTVDEKLIYRCSCGYVDQITFYKFRKLGRRCRQCSIKKLNHSGIKHYYEDIKEYIEKCGYILLTTKEDYINVNTKVKLKCDKGHQYEATFKNFKSHNRRCPMCKITKGEAKVNKYLLEHDLDIKYQLEFDDLIGVGGGKLKFDFAIIGKEVIKFMIEYDGEFHFGEIYDGDSHETLTVHDQIKNQYCIENNIPLIRIPYWDYDNIEYILDSVLANYNLIKKDTINLNLINSYLVNHPSWSHEEYLKKSILHN